MTLSDPDALHAILARIKRLGRDSQPLWGRMTVHEMVCHLKEAYRFKEIRDVSNPFSRTVMRWVALHVNLQWPKDVKTLREMDQKLNPTAGPSFDADLAELNAVCADFASKPQQTRRHPIFGNLTDTEWKIWGWRHADHHLRQFGV